LTTTNVTASGIGIYAYIKHQYVRFPCLILMD